MLRIFLVFFATLLAAVTIAIGASYFALRPTEFKVAVPASDPIDQRVFGLAAETLRSQRAPIRIDVVPVEQDQGRHGCARGRQGQSRGGSLRQCPDGRAHTMMIMRREAAVMIAPKVGKVQKIGDLQNAMIGVTRDGPIDSSLLAPVLDYYGITRDKAR